MKLSYELVPGNKESIVLLHGFLGYKQQWNGLLPFLKGFNLIFIELPGHGNSASQDEPYSIEDLANEINTLIESIGVSKFHAVGHSMGGYVWSAFAKAQSNKLLSLTLINSLGTRDTDQRKEVRNHSLNFIDKYQETYMKMAIGNLFTVQEKSVHKGIIRDMINKAKEMDITSVRHAIVAMRDRPSYSNELSKVKNLIYIAGEEDEVVPLNRIKEEIKLTRGDLFVIACGHMSLVTHPEEIARNMHFIE